MVPEEPAVHRYAPIAQMDRASDYESEGRLFESAWARFTFAYSRKGFRIIRAAADPSEGGVCAGSANGSDGSSRHAV